MKDGQSLLKRLPIEQLFRGKFQPRQHFESCALEELAQSIKANGLLQPILVRPVTKERYEIIAGERRWRATQIAGFKEINCIVAAYDDMKAAEAAAAENLNRIDLNPIEEAKAYQRLVDSFQYSHEEIGAALGKSRSKISNSLRLLTLDPTVQSLLKKNLLHEGHGKTLAGLEPEQQCMLAQLCIKKNLSVRSLEKVIRRTNIKHSEDRKDPNLIQLEEELSSHLGAPTKLHHCNGKGQLIIEFYSLEILDGLLDKMCFKHAIDSEYQQD